MRLVIPIPDITPDDRARVGGKSLSLSMLARNGIRVPEALCISVDAYAEYVSVTGLRERVLLELNRKSFEEMRWEEMWDASLRIRNMFLTTPMPKRLRSRLEEFIADGFAERPVVVRSSAPGEDAAKTSFAGLHESYVNIRGAQSVLEHIHLVWASLWSDRALLYRQELGLDVEKSSMAVIVQELVDGERSGVAFGMSPLDSSQAVIEAVYGLNQGLVDGTIEPDRWILDRATGKVLSYAPARRDKAVFPSPGGVRVGPLPASKTKKPPLDNRETAEVFRLGKEAEGHFGAPQDMEWTFKNNLLYALQSRPITSDVGVGKGDKRSWYLSLHRSFENLLELREKIEGESLPAMSDEAERLAACDVRKMSDGELANEILRRRRIYQKWVDAYWSEFIPFAHGARLFGQTYNDTLRPADPYEFMDLLRGTDMASLERNRLLEEMAGHIRNDPQLAEKLEAGFFEGIDEEFEAMLNQFMDRFGGFMFSKADWRRHDSIIRLLIEMAGRVPAGNRSQGKSIEKLKDRFLSRFEGAERAFAEQLLDIGRASYRLRDDDNIYLGRIEEQVLKATDEGKRKLTNRGIAEVGELEPAEIVKSLRNPAHIPKRAVLPERVAADFRLKPRQLTGQPAGAGIVSGKARVVSEPADLFEFKAGEILVCDAVDPNMTFVVPLSAAIVERRGGMLIHGAIIAREYGLPCVTGVPDATTMIQTGDQLTVDGYLGIVIVTRVAHG